MGAAQALPSFLQLSCSTQQGFTAMQHAKGLVAAILQCLVSCKHAYMQQQQLLLLAHTHVQ